MVLLLRLALANVGDDGNDDALSASLCLALVVAAAAASVPLRTISQGVKSREEGRGKLCLSVCVTCGVGLYHHVVGTWLHTILSIDKMDDRLLSDKIIPNWLAKPKKLNIRFGPGAPRSSPSCYLISCPQQCSGALQRPS